MTALRRARVSLYLGAFLCLTFIGITAFTPMAVWALDAAASQPVVAASQPATAVPAIVEAAKESTQAWWQAALMPVLSVVGLFLASFLSLGLLKLVKLIEKKWNVDIPDSLERMMEDKAKLLVAWLEEEAENRLLNGDGKKSDKAENVAKISDQLLAYAKKLGYDKEWSAEKIDVLIKGILHLNRAGSEGVIGSEGARAEALAKKTPA